MADAIPSDLPATTPTSPSLITLLISALSTVLSTLPPEQATQAAALAGTFLGNIGKPIIQQEIHDAFQVFFTDVAQVGRPTAADDADFDRLRQAS